MRCFLALILVMAAGSSEGLPGRRDLKLTKIGYLPSGDLPYSFPTFTLACFENEIPSEANIRLIYNGANHAGIKTSQDPKCAEFPDAAMPEDGVTVYYVVGFAQDEETFSVIDSVEFEFKRVETDSDMKIFECGGTPFVRTKDVTNCLNGEDDVWCYKLYTCTTPFDFSEDQQWFEYCQIPHEATPEANMQISEETNTVESLAYEGGIINLKESSKDKIEHIVIVKEEFDQSSQVLRIGSEPIAITDFEPSTASYTVCPIWNDEKYSEETIQDINVRGVYVNGYYEFSFNHTNNVEGPFSASAGTSSHQTRNTEFKCDNLDDDEQPRCYGYMKAVSTEPLTLGYKSSDGTDHKVITYLKSASIGVMINTRLICVLIAFSLSRFGRKL